MGGGQLDVQASQEPATAEPSSRLINFAVAFWMFAANCAISWGLGIRYLEYLVPLADFSGPGWVHLPLAYLAQFAALQLIFFGLVALLLTPRWPRAGRWMVVSLFAVFMPLAHLLVYVDGVIYTNYRHHFNAAILEMLLTPGAEDLFAFSLRDYLKAGTILAGMLLAEVAAAEGIRRVLLRRPALLRGVKRYAPITAVAIVLVLAAEKSLYAWADATSRRDVLVNARVIPFYLPATCKHIARRLGVKVDRRYRFSRSLALKYPLEPLQFEPRAEKYNVVWIAIEGWRVDALSAEVSPRLWAFGRKALVAERHYSSGNCTRIGIFGMFYGLDGFYWHPFLAERRGPAMLRSLRERGYEFLVMGAANFKNPEFRLSCFVELKDAEVIHGRRLGKKSPQRDLAIAGKFEEFLEGREGSTPFFCFAFLDSTHSPYRWGELPGFKPPFSGYGEGVRHEKLAGDGDERRRALIRYKNSAAYVDHLVGGMLDGLQRRGLLRKTIVVVTGDHGEEFGENGRFGHGGGYGDFQVRTPLIFHYPGVKPGRMSKMTSHVDLLPTTLKLLGIRNPPRDYCQGLDLLGAERRSYVVATGYSNGALVADDGYRLVFPIGGYRLSTMDILDSDYRPARSRATVLRRHVGKLREALKASKRFKR
jgi:uncharacterized protein